jgi:hypothetical protein
MGNLFQEEMRKLAQSPSLLFSFFLFLFVTCIREKPLRHALAQSCAFLNEFKVHHEFSFLLKVPG